MLVLTRRPYEAIKIGDDIEVRVFRVRNGNVRFALAAPRDVLILRSELMNHPRPAEIPWRASRGKKAACRFPPGPVER
ncbi:carbon storage regulator [Lysobacter enzymogenes]|uniref:carbon storage regulator n=1 Tax=Lysobacter sp. yr284 TaxID=1761791 RepID=UPI00089CE782|nr:MULTISPECIES: carbon storage regulator [Lysobacter]QCW24486.1 carbon storage regulator [Lysobacter enzymogenes]SDZ19799.1 carbon storage regulator, CsrA [Lysobacter sp. yr284]